MIDEKKLKEQIFLWDTKRIPPGGIAFRQQIYDLFPKCQVDIQSPVEDPELRRRTRIEAAIRAFEERAEDFLTANGCDLKGDFADLLRWVLGQEQKTWTDKDFGLEEK